MRGEGGRKGGKRLAAGMSRWVILSLAALVKLSVSVSCSDTDWALCLLADLHPSRVFVWPFPSNRQRFIFLLHLTSYLSCLSMNEHCKRTCLPLLNCPVAIVTLKFRSTGGLALRVPLYSETLTSPVSGYHCIKRDPNSMRSMQNNSSLYFS